MVEYSLHIEIIFSGIPVLQKHWIFIGNTKNGVEKYFFPSIDETFTKHKYFNVEAMFEAISAYIGQDTVYIVQCIENKNKIEPIFFVTRDAVLRIKSLFLVKWSYILECKYCRKSTSVPKNFITV